MKRSVQWYINSGRETIREDGLVTFTKKVLCYLRDIPIGTYFDKIKNRALARLYINGFHKLYYYSDNTWGNTYWLGTPAQKCPLDLWIYQEIIWETKPEVIIETGTAKGGSALFFASIFDLMKKGEVITIDMADDCNVSHPKITKIMGNSVSAEVITQVREIVGNKTAMVVLDSCHEKEHVLKEMNLYNQFVSIGNYLVVEDTNINGHPVRPRWGRGPMEAVNEFLKNRKDFEVDHAKEKFLLTFFPKGFLRRVKPTNQTKGDLLCAM